VGRIDLAIPKLWISVQSDPTLVSVTGADFRAGRFAREIGFVIHAADVAAAF
jgi:hypothetical protein